MKVSVNKKWLSFFLLCTATGAGAGYMWGQGGEENTGQLRQNKIESTEESKSSLPGVTRKTDPMAREMLELGYYDRLSL